MKLAFVGGFGFRPKGTIQGRAFPIAAELARLGHQVKIFVTPYDNLQESSRTWTEEGVEIYGMKVGSTALSYPALFARLVAAVEKFRPDVIHIFKPKGFAGAAGTYFHLKGMRRVVLDCDDWEGWGGFNDIKAYPWILKEYIDRQERWMMRTTPAITVASRTLERRVCDARKTSSGVFYLPNCGTSPGNLAVHARARAMSQTEARAEFGLPAGPSIFYSGHFEPGEDFMLFCRSATAAAERNRSSIVFVGEGPELFRIKQFYKQHPGIQVFFFPRLSYHKFIQLIWACDVAAFPYPDDPVHRSKCSARIIDYMSIGKAVVTSRVGQNTEYIEDGKSGILVGPGDEEAFGRAIDLLLRDATLRKKLGEGAVERIRKNFTWSGEPLRRCLAAYNQVLEASHR